MAITRGSKDSRPTKEEISMSGDDEGPSVDIKSPDARRRKRKLQGDEDDNGRKQRKIVDKGEGKSKMKTFNEHASCSTLT